ncbi:MAG: T9SS type A sorting domain-containing protein [Bacteroidia bacterium]|nr:T9SS type A sorting domain-containing protein [Bacteroidia bacterium]
MKRVLLNIFFLMVYSKSVSAQNFPFIYSTGMDEVISDVTEDSAGNYFVVGIKGNFQIPVLGDYTGLLIKLNGMGDSVSSIQYRYNNQVTYFSSVFIADSSRIIVIGDTFDTLTYSVKILFLELDSNYQVLNEKIIGKDSTFQRVLTVNRGANDDYLIAGYSSDTTNKLMFYRLSAYGDSLQSAYLSGILSFPLAFSLQEVPGQNRYVGYAYSYSIGPSFPAVYNEILLLDNTLNVDSVVYVDNSAAIISGLWQNDTTLIVCTKGYDPNSPPLDWNFRIRRYTNDFMLLSDTMFGAKDTTEAEAIGPISQSNDGSIYFGGTINYQNNYWGSVPAYFLAVKFDSNLIPIWSRYVYYNNEYLNLYKVLATNDGGVLLAGTKYNAATANGQERDIYVIKLDSLGNYVTGTGNSPVAQVHDFIVYPNPAASQLTLQYSPPKATGYATIYNTLGEAVHHLILPTGSSHLKVNIAHLPAGLYLIKVEADGKSGVKRFVRE